MANKQSRINQLIFGDAGATAQFGKIGSESAGAAVTTKDLNVIQALTQYLNGLYAITNNGGEPPRIQDFNSLFLLITTQLRYILQAGIPEWIATAQYFANVSIVNVAGALYQAKTGTDGTPNVNHNPVGDTTNWQLIYTSFNDGNGGQPPAPKPTKTITTINQSATTTIFVTAGADVQYLVSIYNSGGSYYAAAIISKDSAGTLRILQLGTPVGFTLSVSGNNIQASHTYAGALSTTAIITALQSV